MVKRWSDVKDVRQTFTQHIGASWIMAVIEPAETRVYKVLASACPTCEWLALL